MANTAEENALAQTAFRAIARRYTEHFHMNPSVTGFVKAMLAGGPGVGNYVKFTDGDVFDKIRAMSDRGKATATCAVAGFTSYVVGNRYEREIYVNRRYANSSTIIHEMLHFLTHPQFWMYVRPATTEAVTEYFTRKVIRNATEDEFDIDQRKGRYDVHHSFLELGRSQSKKDGTRPMKGYMKAAYFGGDPAAIKFVRESLADLEEMLGAA